MTQWEYRKIALNQLQKKGDDIDLLCEVGLDGWELVAILANSMAYLKRQATRDRISEEASDRTSVPVPASYMNGNHAATASAVKPKYRDPKTGETWSGRGRMALAQEQTGRWRRHRGLSRLSAVARTNVLRGVRPVSRRQDRQLFAGTHA